MLNKICLIVYICSSAELLGSGGLQTHASAVERAEEFCARSGVSFRRSEAKVVRIPNVAGRSYTVTTANVTIIVAPDCSYVQLFQNSQSDLRLRRRTSAGSSYYESEADAWLRAKRFLPSGIEALGLAPYRFAYAGSGVNVREDLRGRARFGWQFKVYGLSTNMVGNLVEIDLDAQTGELVSYRACFDYSYLPPTLNISADEAKAKAILTIRQADPSASVSNPSVIKQYLPTDSGFGSTVGGLLASQRKLPYGYSVTFKRYVVFIGGSGEVLGGGPIK